MQVHFTIRVQCTKKLGVILYKLFIWLIFSVRENAKELNKQYDKSENDLKALQSVGQVCIVNTCIRKITL